MAGKGRPFTKNDPRADKGRGTRGRPKKSVTWKAAEKTLREAIPRILLMPKDELRKLLTKNPTGAEMLAAKYIHEHVPHAIERFLGKTPNVLTGKDGAPLIPKPQIPVLPLIDMSKWTPKQVDDFIAGTKAK